MPEFLNEDYITIAPELIFPAVQSCCAVVATASGINNLAGYHMTLFTNKWEFDRAVLHLKTEIGGAVDCVYLVGNVVGRPGNNRPGLDSLMDLKSAIQVGFGYAFDVKYHDIGANNPGVAVHAWRDAATAHVRLSCSQHGNWALAPNVVPAAGMYFVKESFATHISGSLGSKLRLTRPNSVSFCTINAEVPISTFLMMSL
jgi:hypothetical protein